MCEERPHEVFRKSRKRQARAEAVTQSRGCAPSLREVPESIPTPPKPGVTGHTHNPSVGEVGTGRSEVLGSSSAT